MQKIIPPDNGWKPCTYYSIEVIFNSNNRAVKAILWVEVLDDGSPSSSSQVWNHALGFFPCELGGIEANISQIKVLSEIKFD